VSCLPRQPFARHVAHGALAADSTKIRRDAISLQARFDVFKADFEAGKPPYNVPRPVIETMHRATAELIASGAASRTLKAGDIAPPFVLNEATGNPVTSSALLGRGPLVVSFYRGVWCLHCNMELQALPVFRALGAQVVAISPRNAVSSRKSIRTNGLDFPIPSDAGNQTTVAFGLRFALPGYLVDLYKGLKNDLRAFNDDSKRPASRPCFTHWGRFSVAGWLIEMRQPH
jgi:peroxiredoxin